MCPGGTECVYELVDQDGSGLSRPPTSIGSVLKLAIREVDDKARQCSAGAALDNAEQPLFFQAPQMCPAKRLWSTGSRSDVVRTRFAAARRSSRRFGRRLRWRHEGRVR